MKYSEYRDSKFNYYKRLAKVKGLEFPPHCWERLDEEIYRVYNERYVEQCVEEKIRALLTINKIVVDNTLEQLLDRAAEIADTLDLCHPTLDYDIIQSLDYELDCIERDFYQLMNEGPDREFTLTREGNNYAIYLEERRMCPIYAVSDAKAMQEANAWLSSFEGNHSVSWDVELEYE